MIQRLKGNKENDSDLKPITKGIASMTLVERLKKTQRFKAND